mmetsp:Transcript_27242/g.49485  ORF Transcript_27242/g.49485 Transcript_27242/m.49485 type:complete len:224 (+) Transcript_27242:260-931(+)
MLGRRNPGRSHDVTLISLAHSSCFEASVTHFPSCFFLALGDHLHTHPSHKVSTFSNIYHLTLAFIHFLDLAVTSIALVVISTLSSNFLHLALPLPLCPTTTTTCTRSTILSGSLTQPRQNFLIPLLPNRNLILQLVNPIPHLTTTRRGAFAIADASHLATPCRELFFGHGYVGIVCYLRLLIFVKGTFVVSVGVVGIRVGVGREGWNDFGIGSGDGGNHCFRG